MFCEEKINKVSTIERYESQYEHNKNAFLSFVPELEWRVTEGYWFGFETDNHFLLAGYDGVKILDSKGDLPADEYDVFSDGDFLAMNQLRLLYSKERGAWMLLKRRTNI